MGKVAVSNITVPLSFVVGPKALPIARLSVVASPFAILPPRASRFCPRAPYSPFSSYLTAQSSSPAVTLLLMFGWHPTATRRLAPYCSWLLARIPSGWWLRSRSPLRSFDPLSVRPSRGIALPPWLLSNALDRCNDLRDCASGYSGPMVSVFSPGDDRSPTPLRPPFRVFEQGVSFVLGSLQKGFGLSPCTFLGIVALHVWGISS